MMTSLRRLLLSGNPIRTIRSSLVMGPTPALLKHLCGRLQTNEDSRPTAASSGNIFGAGCNEQVAFAARESSSTRNLILRKLDLDHVPAVVIEKENLLSLDLSYNKIGQLPVNLSSCSSLEVLNLEGNKISEWPGAVFAALPNLQRLVLASNPIQELPSKCFSCLTSLKSLDLSTISARLPLPPALSIMTILEELRLRRMRLQEFPSEVFALGRLRVLDLGQNSLSHIPSEISSLKSLEELDISDNSIMSLPPELGLLETSLQALKLDGNPLKSIRRSVLDRGTKAILQYLKLKLPQPASS
ncbi:hypothetical protein KP509_23G055200 [Ceratopteris richardii]|nr:hypothetical protein KP509_23G055200 [Ceratopteris richardii]